MSVDSPCSLAQASARNVLCENVLGELPVGPGGVDAAIEDQAAHAGLGMLCVEPVLCSNLGPLVGDRVHGFALQARGVVRAENARFYLDVQQAQRP